MFRPPIARNHFPAVFHKKVNHWNKLEGVIANFMVQLNAK